MKSIYKKKKIVEIKEINNNKHEEESYLLTYLYRIDRGVRSSVLGRSLFIITYLARWRGKHVVSRRCSHMWVNTRSKRLGVRSSGYKRWKRGMAEGGELLVSIIRHASNEWFVFEWKLRRDIRYLHRCPCKWYSDGHLPTSTTRSIRRIFFSPIFRGEILFSLFLPPLFFFSLFLLFFSPLDRSRREIDAFDLSRYVEKLFSDNSYLFYDGWYLKRVLNLLILLDFDLWKLKIANSCIIIARWSKKLYNDWFLFSH